MGPSGPPPSVVCAPALKGRSDAPPSHAHRCCVDTRSWNSSLKAAAAPSVWALGVSTSLEKDALFAFEVHLMTSQLFSFMFNVVQRSPTTFLIRTRFSLALGGKGCCREWDWKSSLSSIPNLGFCKSLIYLFCLGQVHPSAFIAPEQAGRRDKILWCDSTRLTSASWQREERTNHFCM